MAALLLAAGAARAGEGPPPLTEAEARGKHIYLTGESPSGSPITAFFGAERFELPGTSATCGSCHGHDGTGRPESGVVPTNVTWRYLTKSYGHSHGGLDHPPFTEETLERYMLTGVYPGGRPGDPSMPVYEMAENDLEDLVAYLGRVGDEPEPGVDETSIRVGSLVPSGGPLAPAGRLIVDTLAAYFRQLNEQGGIYGREIEFRPGSVTASGEAAAGEVRAWLAETDPFLMVANLTPGAETSVGSVVAEAGVPLVAPVTLYPVEEYALNRHTFFLYPGLAVQARALIRFAAEQDGGVRRLAVVHPPGRVPEGVIAAAAESCRELSWPEPDVLAFSGGPQPQRDLARELRAAGVDAVLHLGVEPELREFLAATAAESWEPRVLASGMLSGTAATRLPEDFAGSLYVAYPTLPSDRGSRALDELRTLLGERARSPSGLQVSIAAAAAARLAIAGLQRGGRRLTREGLEAELESLYRFETGLTPPVSYTGNRRQGINGAYVVAFRGAAGARTGRPSAPEWVELQ